MEVHVYKPSISGHRCNGLVEWKDIMYIIYGIVLNLCNIGIRYAERKESDTDLLHPLCNISHFVLVKIIAFSRSLTILHGNAI